MFTLCYSLKWLATKQVKIDHFTLLFLLSYLGVFINFPQIHHYDMIFKGAY